MRIQNGLWLSLALSLVLAGCARSPEATDPYADLPIDAAIQGQDRQVLGDYMRTLDPEDREYVVMLGDDGKLRSNRSAIGKAFEVFTASDNSGRYTNTKGQSISGPVLQRRPLDLSAQVVSPECKSTTGAYRRVFSQPGYSWQSARVALPSTLNNEIYENKASGDTAFIYMGGWGDIGGAVDAGFQHGRYANSATDDWAPIIAVESPTPGADSTVSLSPDNALNSGKPFRLKAGQEIFFKFYVTKDANGTTYVNLSAQGVPNFDATVRTTTFSAPVAAKFAWSPTGGGNILKRMTSIGQTTQNLGSGSYLKGARWSASMIGTASTNAQLWSSAVSGSTSNYCSFPDPNTAQGQSTTAPNKKKIDVQYVSPAEETDNIYLQN